MDGSARFLTHYLRPLPGTIRIRTYPLRGGLESTGVARVHAVFQDRTGRPRSIDFVRKCVPAELSREAAAYRLLLCGQSGSIAPRLLGIVEQSAGQDMQMFLEWIQPNSRWPWNDTKLTSLAIRRLAFAHASLPAVWFQPPHVLGRWDYEQELRASAESTLQLCEQFRVASELASLRPVLPALRRLVTALPVLRSQLRASDLGTAVLHGDAHSGNVIMRARGKTVEPVLLDWGRTRVGSPLEDVSSWLQSLGFWEPEARRKHDTLLRHYLEARGFGTRLTPSLRSCYWIAAVSNGLSGAIRYHLHTCADTSAADSRRQSAYLALADWLRVVRRADAVCC